MKEGGKVERLYAKFHLTVYIGTYIRSPIYVQIQSPTLKSYLF